MGQIDCEFRELTFYAGDKYFSVMCFNHLINEIQAHSVTGSTIPAGTLNGWFTFIFSDN